MAGSLPQTQHAVHRGLVPRHKLRRDGVLQTPVTGFATHTPDGTVGELAAELVRIARGGLRRRGLGEAMYLAPLEEIVATQESHATAIGRLFRTEWNGSVTPLLQHMAL